MKWLLPIIGFLMNGSDLRTGTKAFIEIVKVIRKGMRL